MKSIIFMILAVMLTAASALAVTVTAKVPFDTATGVSGAVAVSDVYDTVGKKTKTLHVTGVNATDSVTFKNMSGTLLAQCAPTTTGPWVICVANEYAQTAISRTTSGTFTWTDVSQYIRFQWTAGTVSTKLKAWFFYSE